MKQLIISHKEVWTKEGSYFTLGGFPFQINAMSEIFSETTLICALRKKKRRTNLTKLFGKCLTIIALPEPLGIGWKRHLAIIFWIPVHIRSIWISIKSTDIVHTMIPGDIGLIGTILTLIQKKPLFIRHCGTWGNRTTITDRFIHWLLPKIANGKTIVMATGGGYDCPEPMNKSIKWIFSTSITNSDWENIEVAKPWDGNEKLNLITVSRLTFDKNIQSIILSLSEIKDHFEVHLNIVGDGIEMDSLLNLTQTLGLDNIITFHGNCSHERVLKLLSKSNIFIFPTNTKEGFPKALLESMACGLPSIAANISVIPFLIESKCGLVLDQTLPSSVSEKIIEMTSCQNQMQNMAIKARSISKKYTLENWQKLISRRLEKSWGELNEL